MSKKRPTFPRKYDKHEPPEIEDIFWKKSKHAKKKVTLTIYSIYTNKLGQKIFGEGVCTYKRKFKNRKAALQSLESEKKSKYKKIINYKIETL